MIGLGERRGLLLVHLPPDQERDDDRLDYFLRGLPEWMRVAVELRHHSWAVDPVFDLLRTAPTSGKRSSKDPHLGCSRFATRWPSAGVG